jgi:molecular chaperone IbpA
MSTVKATSCHPHLVGFESLFDLATRQSRKVCYPPHNIVRVDEDRYVIELAIAGFVMDDLHIEKDGHVLVVSGNTSNHEVKDYVYKGLSSRNFNKKFDLAEDVEVNGANVSNGILYIELEVITPDTAPIEIQITEDSQ